jgi:hypothetical protein
MNHMIHIAAVTQLRLDTEGRDCFRRKRTGGKKPMDAMRCPKRRISDAVYRHLVADEQRAALGHPQQAADASPGGTVGRVSRIQRGRPAPAHRHFGSATSWTREIDATTHPAPPADSPMKIPQDDPLTTEASRFDAAPLQPDSHWLSRRWEARPVPHAEGRTARPADP